MGNRMVKILDIEDHSVHNRQLDQVKINEVGRSGYNFNDSATNPDFVDNSEVRPDDTDENNIPESSLRNSEIHLLNLSDNSQAQEESESLKVKPVKWTPSDGLCTSLHAAEKSLAGDHKRWLCSEEQFKRQTSKISEGKTVSDRAADSNATNSKALVTEI
ncbi:unnamed protein product [Trichobilharzia regenti]|nr:unnamed protein product [Trichobilharzia regenti]